jgi:hypothetical protein
MGQSRSEHVIENLEVERHLAQLREEHRDLDLAIEAVIAQGSSDQLRVARLKKRKLALKDEINVLEARMIPDIIA